MPREKRKNAEKQSPKGKTLNRQDRQGEATGFEVKFWLALAAMLLSLTVARAQTSPGPVLHTLPELTSEQKAKCMETVRRFNRRECDNTRGCFFYDPPDEIELAQRDLECRLQQELQRRAEEARKKLEAQR
jgi:hypothetical protein